MMRKLIILIILLCPVTALGQNMYGVTYNMALPLGQTSGFVNSFSARGLGFEAKYMLDDNFIAGFGGGWNVFYEKEEGSFQDGTQTITGTRYKYLNAFPLMITFDYSYILSDLIRPFGGLGFGAYWIEERTELGVYSESTDNWHLGLAPEVGILIPINYTTSIYSTFKYNIALKSGDSMMHQYLGLNIGLLWD